MKRHKAAALRSYAAEGLLRDADRGDDNVFQREIAGKLAALPWQSVPCWLFGFAANA